MPKDHPATHATSKSEVVFSGKIWDVAREFFDYNGETLVREFVKHPGSVAVVALNQMDEVLLIHQYRHPVREYLWEIPAGLLDVLGESKLDSAKRELLEETGYMAEDWSQLIEFYTTPGGNSEKITVFLARELSYQGYDLELEGEEVDMKLEWIPLAEALTSVLTSEMRSPSATVGIMAAAHKLRA